jgi:hypothetical protein
MKTKHNKIIKRKRTNTKKRTMKKGGAKSGKGWKSALSTAKKSSNHKMSKPPNASLLNARKLFGSIGEAH